MHTHEPRDEDDEVQLAANPLHDDQPLGQGSQRGDIPADRFIADLTAFDFLGRHLDVRENVRFQGGHFSRWIHSNFETGCCLAVEFKKFFMNEWTGEFNPEEFEAVPQALSSTIPGLHESLRNIGSE